MKFSHTLSTITARILVVLILVCNGNGFAHRVKVFATASGNTIEGSAYFPGGDPLPNVEIRIEGPDKELLGTTTTDSEGEFNFTANRACDHHIVLVLADGHSAEFTIPAGDLLLAQDDQGKTNADNQATVAQTPEASGNNEPAPPPSQLEKTIDAAVARRIKPLERQIEALIDQRRIQDIVGGIGYILGLTGIALWIGAIGRKKADKEEDSSTDKTAP